VQRAFTLYLLPLTKWGMVIALLHIEVDR
jgi:hypothetical protein